MAASTSAHHGSNATLVKSFCTECGHEHEQPVPTIIRARVNNNYVRQILDGTLFTLTCPNCGATSFVEHPCLFLDPDHKACAYLIDRDTFQIVKDNGTWAFDHSHLLNEQYDIQRVSFTTDALRELVLTFTNGLDDRVIELLKYDLRTELMVNGLTLKKGLIKSIRLDSVDGDYLTYAVTYDNERATVKKSIRAYEEIKRALLASSLADMQPLRVDSLWAAATHNTLENEGLI